MQSLGQFVAELKEEVAAFEEFWREQHKAKPKEWPLHMEDDNEGGWWEQFIAYQSLRGKGPNA
jgi:hypothetical protein